jgi:hypothetical protein
MTQPYSDPNDNTLDKKYWDKLLAEPNPRNPYNRQPLKAEDLKCNTELQKQIDEFKEKNPAVWNAALEKEQAEIAKAREEQKKKGSLA